MGVVHYKNKRMEMMRMRKSSRARKCLWLCALLCSFMSVLGVIFIGDKHMDFENGIVSYYSAKQTYELCKSITKAMFYKNTYTGELIPVLPIALKGILVFATVFVISTMMLRTRMLKVMKYYAYTSAVFVCMQWILFLRKVVYIPIMELLLFPMATILCLSLVKTILFENAGSSLSVSAIAKFIGDIDKFEETNVKTYKDYLEINKEYIEKSISVKLIDPVANVDSRVIKELLNENAHSRRFVELWIMHPERVMGNSVLQIKSKIYKKINYLVFVPLPVFGKEEEVNYTVLGVTEKVREQRAAYISTMMFSMFIYFKANEERNEHHKMYFSMLSLMISVIDAKDPVTAGHSQRVADLSKQIGKWLKLDKSVQHELEFAALMHDIGKIGVSDYVLNKPSVFTKNDFEQMKNHTVRGAEILKTVGMSDNIVEGVRHHHERIDGRGYPDNISGDKLNLLAKVIKIADVYDALTTKRQYKEPWQVDKALNIIYRGRGTEFDSDIADVFIKNMAPQNWVPLVDNKKILKDDPFIDKAIDISVDFYQKYCSEIDEDYAIAGDAAEAINLFAEKNFMEYDWGETFNNEPFLEGRPTIIAYEKSTQSLVFAQNCMDKYANSVYYYFFKGFVNMGLYLLKGDKVDDVMDEIVNKCGAPVYTSDQHVVYNIGRTKMVLYHTNDDKSILYYIPEYMCTHYVYESKEENACS